MGTERFNLEPEPDEPVIRFRQLLDSIEDVFLLSTLEPFRNLYVSPNVKTVFGIDPEQLELDSFLAVVHPHDRGRLADVLANLGPSQPNTEIDHRIQRDGTVRWMRARLRTVTGPAGEARMASVVTDITADHQLRTELAAARDDAQVANTRKSEFLAHMSHELRTPLHAILGFTQLLELDAPRPDQLDPLHHIRQAGQRLLEVIEDILDLQRVERGALQVTIEALDPVPVMRDTIDLLAPQAARGDIAVTADAPGPAFLVAADAQRLRQVLINLVSNAIKYNHRSGRVTVTAEPATPTTARLTVTDSGIGIAPDELPHVFEPFTRSQRSAHTEGAGIGLALTRQLVEAMDGTIAVTSTTDIGTTFTVTLPVP